MELWEVFSKLKEQKGVSIADIANATGLPYTTVDSIIKKKLKDIKYSVLDLREKLRAGGRYRRIEYRGYLRRQHRH